MKRVARVVSWVFALAYAVALGLFLIGTFGIFGAERDPLAGIFLVPLGLPWIFFADYLPSGMQPLVAIFAPLLNLGILRWLAAPRGVAQ